MLSSTARLSLCVAVARTRGIVTTGLIKDMGAKSQKATHGSEGEEPQPEMKQQGENTAETDEQHADADSAVWRDRISAKIKMAATPEARSLSSL